MAAPIYKQADVNAMIVTPKFVPFDEWDTRVAGRMAAVGEHRYRIKAHPLDKDDFTQFRIECCEVPARSEASYTLFGKRSGHPEQPLCRYEFQIGKHGNPKWFEPFVIVPRAIHKHVYNERAIREDLTWDACASVCTPPVASLQLAINRLTPLFLQECCIDIHDPNVTQSMFSR